MSKKTDLDQYRNVYIPREFEGAYNLTAQHKKIDESYSPLSFIFNLSNQVSLRFHFVTFFFLSRKTILFHGLLSLKLHPLRASLAISLLHQTLLQFLVRNVQRRPNFVKQIDFNATSEYLRDSFQGSWCSTFSSIISFSRKTFQNINCIYGVLLQHLDLQFCLLEFL